MQLIEIKPIIQIVYGKIKVLQMIVHIKFNVPIKLCNYLLLSCLNRIAIVRLAIYNDRLCTDDLNS